MHPRCGGGKGANQALSIHRLGGRVLFYEKIGDDIFGHYVLDKIKKKGCISHRFVLCTVLFCFILVFFIFLLFLFSKAWLRVWP
jgi:sugar/nucleoside kinase (ribokinase family)